MKKANFTPFSKFWVVLCLMLAGVLAGNQAFAQAAQCALIVNDVETLSIDQDCSTPITPENVMEDELVALCANTGLVVERKVGSAWVPAVATAADVNSSFQVRVRQTVAPFNISALVTIRVIDRLAPVHTCVNLTLSCALEDYTPSFITTSLCIPEGIPTATDNCSGVTRRWSDVWIDYSCTQSATLSGLIVRTWEFIDASGNRSTCVQNISIDRVSFDEIVLPDDFTVACAAAINPNNWPVPCLQLGNCTTRFIAPLFDPNRKVKHNCSVGVEYKDHVLAVCDGTDKILRTWKLVDWCLPIGSTQIPVPAAYQAKLGAFFSNPVEYIQLIKIVDLVPPTFAPLPDVTVSTDPNTCCATVDMPDVIVTDVCSRIATSKITIEGYNTHLEPIGTFTIGSRLSNFPGNNLWNPDTLMIGGITPCLPLGHHLVTYSVMDDCGNHATATFTLHVLDQTPPNADCVTFTTVGINLDDPNDEFFGNPDRCQFGGQGWARASLFDKGSYDNCGPVKMTVRRMPPYSECVRGLNNVTDFIRGGEFVNVDPDKEWYDWDPTCKTAPEPAANGFDPDGDTFLTEYGVAIAENDSIKFYCCEVGTTQTVIFRVYQVNPKTGRCDTDIWNECMVQVEVQDKLRPTCVAPLSVTVNCEQYDPSLFAYGNATASDNCCLDATKVYQGVKGLTHSLDVRAFDTVCHRGTIVRTWTATDCRGLTSRCTQRIVVTYREDYYVSFPDDVLVTFCDSTGVYGEPEFYGKDCELLATTYTDEPFTLVTDACFKIERTWKVINWCWYDANDPDLYYVYNPDNTDIGAIVSPSNAPLSIGRPRNKPSSITSWRPFGPNNPSGTLENRTVQAFAFADNDLLWRSAFVARQANPHVFIYKQIIKIVDQVAPTATPFTADLNCNGVAQTVACGGQQDVADFTTNRTTFWNDASMKFNDPNTNTHDLCEAPSSLCIDATDRCSGANVDIRYQLFLDLDQDGDQETVVNSVTSGTMAPGTIVMGNALTTEPDVTLLFDNRPGSNAGRSDVNDPNGVDGTIGAAGDRYQFIIETTVTGKTKRACVRWRRSNSGTAASVAPLLPHGTHSIRWVVSDGCGNERACQYTVVVRDCKKPSVVCINGLSTNIMNSNPAMARVFVSDYVQWAEDNCTKGGRVNEPGNQLVFSMRKGEGTTFPLDANRNPITELTFTCAEVGQQRVEVWVRDLAGNADRCATYLLVQDPNRICVGGPRGTVAGVLATEGASGLQEGNVKLDGKRPDNLPDVSMFDLSDATGKYSFDDALPISSSYIVTPTKDDNPLNGVNTFDLALISKHMLGLEPLNTPYKLIAADANKNGSITNFDIVELRKLILGVYEQLPANSSWRFVDKSFTFANPNNPFAAAFPETRTVAQMQTSKVDDNFVAIKVGDVNGDAAANTLTRVETRSAGNLLFDVQDREVKAGDIVTVNFKAAEKVLGYQFTLNTPGLEVMDITPGAGMKVDNFAVFAEKQALTTSFDGKEQAEFAVTFKATAAGKLSQMLQLSSQITEAAGFGEGSERLDVALRFNSKEGQTIAGVGFELYQNAPNPFIGTTFIGFHLPAAAKATLSVYDETGRVLFTQKGDFAKGRNTIAVDRTQLNHNGLMYYKLETEQNTATRKMIQTSK
jgi:hypothetical protein